jgi:hypothetical protein
VLEEALAAGCVDASTIEWYARASKGDRGRVERAVELLEGLGEEGRTELVYSAVVAGLASVGDGARGAELAKQAMMEGCAGTGLIAAGMRACENAAVAVEIGGWARENGVLLGVEEEEIMKRCEEMVRGAKDLAGAIGVKEKRERERERRQVARWQMLQGRAKGRSALHRLHSGSDSIKALK